LVLCPERLQSGLLPSSRLVPAVLVAAGSPSWQSKEGRFGFIVMYVLPSFSPFSADTFVSLGKEKVD